MSTTIKRLLWILPLVLICWVGVMALVLFPGEGLMQHLPEPAAILSVSSAALALANRPGLASELCDAGARLVLTAG